MPAMLPSSSYDGPIFSAVAKLVEALERTIPEGPANAERKKKAHISLSRWSSPSAARP
jgi:hypothetical protein